MPNCKKLLFLLLTALSLALLSNPAAASSPPLPLPVRDYTPCPDVRLSKADCDGQDGAYLVYNEAIDPAKTALILVDVWANHANPDFVARLDANVRDYLLPLLETARADGRLLIIHYKNGYGLNDRIIPQPGEIVADDGDTVIQALQARGITTLIFAGYATNMCLVNRKASIMWLWHKYGQYQHRIVVVRDATVAIGAPDISPDEARRNVIMFLEINNYAASTTVEELRAALEAEPAPLRRLWLPLVFTSPVAER